MRHQHQRGAAGGMPGKQQLDDLAARIAQLVERLPEGHRLTPDSLFLPDGTEIEFGAAAADDQFAQIFRSSCRQEATPEELADILDKAVNSLAPPYRTVFQLRDIEELSTEETAQALDLSVPAVKSRLLRARLQLRDKLTAFFKKKVEDPFAYL